MRSTTARTYRVGRDWKTATDHEGPARALKAVLTLGEPCVVWKKRRGHWHIVLDCSLYCKDRLPLPVYARNVFSEEKP